MTYIKSILLLCFLGTFSFAQTQTFGAEAIAGLNMSQIDGDASAGYNKIGLTGGVRGLIYLKPKKYASIGIMFAQRGAQNELNTSSSPTGANNFSLTLNYAEIPVLFHVRDWAADADEDETYYKMDFHGGLSYARLLGSKLRDDLGVIQTVAADLNKDDFAIVLGGAYHFSENLLLQFQWKRSFTSILNVDGQQTAASPRGANWIGHLVTLQCGYSF